MLNPEDRSKSAGRAMVRVDLNDDELPLAAGRRGAGGRLQRTLATDRRGAPHPAADEKLDELRDLGVHLREQRPAVL